jgi:hypothetical protein
MIDRDKSGIRSVGVRARLAIAAAVIVGGGAAGVVAVNASHDGPTTAQSAGFTTSHTHGLSQLTALTEAMNGWSSSPSTSLTALSKMAPMRTFSQFSQHKTTFAVQRGVVVLATKKFIVVKSANHALHLWWLSGATHFKNVGATMTGMAAMIGSDPAATAAMTTGTMVPAATVMAGSTGAVSQLTTTTAKPTTITIDTGGQTITITVASSTATVTQPMTMTSTSMTQGTQPVFRSTMGVHRGDLILIAGTREHGELMAKIVLFAAPGSFSPAPTATPTATPSTGPSPTVTPSANSTVAGTHS